VDGIKDIELDDALMNNAEKGTGVACVVNSYAGASRKGYAPYNMGKKNQDAIIMCVGWVDDGRKEGIWPSLYSLCLPRPPPSK
jgi:hypothetical protein